METKTSSADLELLKWEYRCRALEQEKAGLQRRNASLTSDLKQEFKENKRNNRVVNTMLKALVDARQQVLRLDADADTSSLDAALRFALSGKEVVWPDQTGIVGDENAGNAENKDAQGATFASPKPGKASQSLCMASPDQLHTPTHAEANARAPMRSLSRSISRSKLASSGGGHLSRLCHPFRVAPVIATPAAKTSFVHCSLPSTAVSAIPSAAGTPTRIPTPSKTTSGRKRRAKRSPTMMATPLQLRTPSHWAVPEATGKLSSTPVPEAPAPAPEEPERLPEALPTPRLGAMQADPSRTRVHGRVKASAARGMRRSNSTPALNMTAALNDASDEAALQTNKRAVRAKLSRQTSASGLGRTFTASPMRNLPVIEASPAPKAPIEANSNDDGDANSTFTMDMADADEASVKVRGERQLGEEERARQGSESEVRADSKCLSLPFDTANAGGKQPAEDCQQLKGKARRAGKIKGGSGSDRPSLVGLFGHVCEADKHAVQGGFACVAACTRHGPGDGVELRQRQDQLRQGRRRETEGRSGRGRSGRGG